MTSEPATRAWWAFYGNDTDEGVIVFAPTRGKARNAGAAEFGECFIRIRVVREPKADTYAAQGFVTLAAGLADELYGWVECGGCYRKISPDDEYCAEGDDVFCLKCHVERFRAGVYPEGSYCTLLNAHYLGERAAAHQVFSDGERVTAWYLKTQPEIEQMRAANWP